MSKKNKETTQELVVQKKQAVVEQKEKESNPSRLLEIAVQSGADVEKLERLMALQERYEAAQAQKAYFGAMNTVQTELLPVVRDSFNQQTNSKYAKLEAVHKVLLPVYTKHGFSVSFSEEKAEEAGMIRFVAEVMHNAGHMRKYHIDLPLDTVGIKGNENKTKMHGKGSSISYGRRYLEMQIFNMTVVNEDDDGNGGSKTITEAQADTINKMIEESGANKVALLGTYGVSKIEDIPAVVFSAIIKILNAKIDAKNVKKEGAK